MANLQCKPATAVTTQSATLHGTGDNIPLTNKLRIDYSFTAGGPYATLGTAIPGTNSAGQTVTENVIGLAPQTPYYYVVRELDAGNNIIDTSPECNLKTLDYNVTCEVLSGEGVNPVQIRICADFVSDGLGGKAPQMLQVVSGTVMGGPYTTVEGQVPGTFVDNQCQVFLVNLLPCEVKFLKGRVTPVPAEYEVDWAYDHMGRASNQTETVEMRLGSQADYIAGGGEPNGYNSMTLVDTHAIPGNQAHQWFHRSGTFPVPSGVNQLHMAFKSVTPPPPSSIGNFLDNASIILRRVVPSPLVIGEQIVNGGFEFPTEPNGSVTFPPEEPVTPGIAWRTTDPVNVLEYWAGPVNNTDGTGLVPAPPGNQWAELNAFNPAELYQIVDLAVGVVDSIQECQAFSFRAVADCAGANVTTHFAFLCGQVCAAPGYRAAYKYGPCGEGMAFQSEFLIIPQFGPYNFCLPVFNLDCEQCYDFQMIILNPQFDPIFEGPICTLTTTTCPPNWCGGEFDVNDCVLVDPGNGSPYYNCNQV